MKAVRFAMLIVMISFTVLSFASDEKHRGRQFGIKIPIEYAVKDRGLVFEMYRQIDQSFLNYENPGIYRVKIKYRKNTVEIYGTYKQWMNFFVMDNLPSLPERDR